MELEILRAIQSIANPFFDGLFQLITMFGEDVLIIIFMAIIYWTYDKKLGEYLAYAALTSAALNGMVKNIFKAKRPIGEEGIRSLRVKTATGYSFPSGHSQGAASFYGGLAIYLKKKWSYIIGSLLIAAIGFSRMYLGVHYPKDVVCGIALGLLSSYITYKIYQKIENKLVIYLITFVVFVLTLTFSRSADFIKSLGAYSGFILGIYIEKKYINFSVEGKTVNKVLRVVVGLISLLLIKAGLKLILPNTLIFHFIRYMCIAFFAVGVYPMSFKRYNEKET